MRAIHIQSIVLLVGEILLVACVRQRLTDRSNDHIYAPLLGLLPRPWEESFPSGATAKQLKAYNNIDSAANAGSADRMAPVIKGERVATTMQKALWEI